MRYRLDSFYGIIMIIPEPRQFGILVKRYKRFLADIQLEDEQILTVHCPNSGSMKGCSTPGSRVVISQSANPKRKYPWTLEMIRENGVWIGVNTSLTNKIVREGIENSTIDDFGIIESIQPEVKVSEQSRLDFLLRTERGKVYVEVKNCSLAENGAALFPDAVTKRGAKHLLELERLRAQGNQAAVLFCVQRSDAEYFVPAEKIDPEYAKILYSVHAKDVKVLAYQADVQPESVTLAKKLKVFNKE